jgi:hypothetical protein
MTLELVPAPGEGSQRYEARAGEGQPEAVETKYRCKARSHEWKVRASAAA